MDADKNTQRGPYHKCNNKNVHMHRVWSQTFSGITLMVAESDSLDRKLFLSDTASIYD